LLPVTISRLTISTPFPYTTLFRSHFTSRTMEKHFGLSRATTLLHFVSGGRFPIFDSRVRKAVARLLNCSVPNDVPWYLDSYCPLDRKSTRLNSSHGSISYAVFCLK